jgi:hypothetical protein
MQKHRVRTKISIKGVLLGGITDIVSTNLFSIPLVIYAAVFIGLSGDKSPAAFQNATQHNILFTMLIYVTGCLGSIVGGYVAAWIAKRAEILNGTLSAWLCAALGIFGMVTTTSSSKRLEELASLPVTFLLDGAGGYLRKLQMSRGAVKLT